MRGPKGASQPSASWPEDTTGSLGFAPHPCPVVTVMPLRFPDHCNPSGEEFELYLRMSLLHRNPSLL